MLDPYTGEPTRDWSPAPAPPGWRSGDARSTAAPALAALGIGFGGFVDGIVLHQILQWHHMLSAEGCCPTSTVLGLEDNTLADGFFHVATWIALMAGTIVAMRA